MNKQEYAEYQRAVDRGLEGLAHISSGECSGCDECRDTYGYDDETEEFEYPAEGSFSWSGCDVCGSTLGGDRYPMHGVMDDGKGELIHLEACEDCVYFCEYGQLDDQTMDELTGEEMTV